MKNKIEEFRKPLGLSQHRLGKRVGVSRQTIMAIENDKKDPNLRLALKICGVLDKKIDEVFELEYN